MPHGRTRIDQLLLTCLPTFLIRDLGFDISDLENGGHISILRL